MPNDRESAPNGCSLVRQKYAPVEHGRGFARPKPDEVILASRSPGIKTDASKPRRAIRHDSLKRKKSRFREGLLERMSGRTGARPGCRGDLDGFVFLVIVSNRDRGEGWDVKFYPPLQLCPDPLRRPLGSFRRTTRRLRTRPVVSQETYFESKTCDRWVRFFRPRPGTVGFVLAKGGVVLAFPGSSPNTRRDSVSDPPSVPPDFFQRLRR